jgi:hypothetical protein
VQVPSCTVNLNLEGSYSRRYKACSAHRKALVVSMGPSQDERFCQQCGRFEPIDAFEGRIR